MIDYKEVIELYSGLDLNDKRNEYSILLQKVDGLLLELLKKKKVDTEPSVKNYNTNSDRSKTEDEMLTFFYEDLINIKNKLLLLMTVEMVDDKKE